MRQPQSSAWVRSVLQPKEATLIGGGGIAIVISKGDGNADGKRICQTWNTRSNE